MVQYFLSKNLINIFILESLKNYEEGKVCYRAKFHEIKSVENFDFRFRPPVNMHYFEIEKIQLKYLQEVQDSRSKFPL